jgi:hypothetical protein
MQKTNFLKKIQQIWVKMEGYTVMKRFVANNEHFKSFSVKALPIDSSNPLTGSPRSSLFFVICVKSEMRRVTGSLTVQHAAF